MNMVCLSKINFQVWQWQSSQQTVYSGACSVYSNDFDYHCKSHTYSPRYRFIQVFDNWISLVSIEQSATVFFMTSFLYSWQDGNVCKTVLWIENSFYGRNKDYSWSSFYEYDKGCTRSVLRYLNPLYFTSDYFSNIIKSCCDLCFIRKCIKSLNNISIIRLILIIS